MELKKNILVVDDVEDIRHQLSKHLTRHNYNVLTASSIKTAKDIIVNEKINCIILDLTLDNNSEFGGMDVFHFARSNSIKVVILSAYVFKSLKDNFSNEIKPNLLSQIENDYIHKGGEKNYITAVIDKLKKIEKKEKKIFICYAEEDKEKANKLYNDLKNKGLKPWIANEDIIPGERWKYSIKCAIKDCTHFIALLSEKSINKDGYVNKEVKIAIDILDEMPASKIFFIPARIETCDPLLDIVQNIQWVDLFPSWEDGINKILNAIN